LIVLFVQHLHNLWQYYYEDTASAAAQVVALYQVLAAELDDRACPSEMLIYSYYESISSHKVNSVVCGLSMRRLSKYNTRDGRTGSPLGVDGHAKLGPAYGKRISW